MKSRRGCLIGLLAAVLLFSLLLMAGSWWLLQQVRQRTSMSTPAPPILRPTVVRVTAGPYPPIVLVDPKLDKLEQAWQNAPAGQLLEVTMSEQELEKELLAGLAGAPAQGYQLDDLQLLPDQVRIAGRADVSGLEVPVTAVGRVSAADCWLDVEITQLLVGPLPAPAAVKQQFQDQLDRWSEASRQNPPMCVAEVTISQGQVTLVGVK
ncbi:MAG: hypothetical protein ACP5TV_04650, partial [Anaerolineae bacterium]